MTTQLQPANTAKKDIRSYIQSSMVKEQLAMVLPKHLTPDRMARVACTTIMRSPKLAQCTQESLLNCLMQCSQLGLEPDGRRAHLIPFENRQKGTTECTLIVDWKGLAELALRSGMIAKLHADLVCENDDFDFDLGDILHHKIDFKKPRGNPYAVYAMAVTKTGERFVQVMTKEEVESIRDNSQGWKSFKKGYAHQSPWQDSPGEMWKKTAFRRLSKWLPLSPEYRDAIEIDDDPQITVAATSGGVEMLPLPPVPDFTPPTAIEEGAAELAPVPRERPARGPRAVRPAPAAELKPQEPAEQPAEAQPALPTAGTEQSNGHAIALLALKGAMDTAEVYEAQIVAFFNEQLRDKGTPEIMEINQIPEGRLVALAKNLNARNEGVIAKLKGYAPV